MKQKTLKQMIEEFKDEFEKYSKENPDIAQKIKQDLLLMSGITESELDEEMMKDEGYYYVIVKIPVDKLSIFGTFCGRVGNRPFTEEVINFLKSKKVEFVFAITFNDEPKILSLAVQLDRKSGYHLENMIVHNGGSLRSEPSNKLHGWMVYESE